MAVTTTIKNQFQQPSHTLIPNFIS